MDMDLPIKLLLLFSGIGILDTIYISYHNFTNTDVWCPIFPKEWCKKVQYSSFSKTLGIPNGYLGLLLYTMIFALSWMYFLGSDTFFLIKLLAGIGFAFAAYFTLIQAFILRAFCVWCIVSAINLTVIFAAAFFMK